MSSAQVFELCKKCKRANKMRIDFLGEVRIVDVVCDCEKIKREKNKQRRYKARKYYGER